MEGQMFIYDCHLPTNINKPKKDSQPMRDVLCVYMNLVGL